MGQAGWGQTRKVAGSAREQGHEQGRGRKTLGHGRAVRRRIGVRVGAAHGWDDVSARPL